ncbi:MAG: DUF4340 domain-containing protein [Chloroflexi bacterium]|nr:DUF4340 domain-containing protein [Chloroflexota bacterium]
MSIRTSIILVVSLAMVAGYVFFVQLKQVEDVPDEPPWFYSVDLSDLTRIAITDRGEETVFFLGADENWHIDEPDGLPVSQDRWGGIVLLLTGPKSRRLLDEQPTDLEPYGLVVPQTRVEVDLRDGRSIKVLLGLATPDGESTYGQVEGFPQVFTIFDGWKQSMTRLISEPPYPEWYYNVDTSGITTIQIFSRTTGMAMTKGQDGWLFDNAEQSAVDESQMPLLLVSLENPSQTLVAYSPIDLVQYGLNNPSLTLFLQTEKPDEEGFTVISQSRYTVGGLTEDGTGYYVQTQRGQSTIPDVFMVNADWVDGLQAIADDPPYLDDVTPGT